MHCFECGSEKVSLDYSGYGMYCRECGAVAEEECFA